MEKIVILGNGGHARSLIDILERENKYEIAGFVVNDKEKIVTTKYPIIGSDQELEKIFQRGITNAAMGIGYLGKSDLRERLWAKIKEIGYNLPIICDPSAVLSSSALIEEGCFIGKGAIINSNVSIGKMCIINTGAIIEHDCKVEDFTHISVGSILCGNAKVGQASFVGAGSTIIQGISIGNYCIIGAGTTVRNKVEDRCMMWNKEIDRKISGDIK